MNFNDLLIINDLQSKRKSEEDQGEELGEKKIFSVSCHTTLLVHCMTAQIMTAITEWNVFNLCTANMLQCLQSCKSFFILAHYG